MLFNLLQLEELARQIAATCKAGDVICLHGDLGSGKTTFTRCLIGALCESDVEVASPTFNILLNYEAPQFTIWHYDLYRIQAIDELQELALDEAINFGLTIIEWPEIAMPLLPPQRTMHVYIKFVEGDAAVRNIHFS